MEESDLGSLTEEQLKKKQQNSVRWKRWWLKNRETYNEKRRLSAQMRSAKNRALKEKAMQARQQEQEPANLPENYEVPSTKRVRKSREEEAATAAQTAVIPTFSPDRTAPPSSGMRPFLQQIPIPIPPYQPAGGHPIFMHPAHPFGMQAISSMDWKAGPPMGRFYPTYMAAAPTVPVQFMYNIPHPQTGNQGFPELSAQLVPPTALFNLK